MIAASQSVTAFPARFSPASAHVSERNSGRLSSAALFEGLSDEESYEILLSGRPRTYEPDEIIFVQGHPATAMYLIEAGSVKLTQVSPDGSEVILWVNGFGESIGTQAESPTGLYSCTARVVDRCKLITWDQARLISHLGRFPRLRGNLNQILSKRLQELEVRFREVATERVAHRLAMTLLRLRTQIGKQHMDGVRISLSREELAQMTGTTLFTISRLLSRWGESGIITPLREAVIVVDAKRLELMGECCD